MEIYTVPPLKKRLIARIHWTRLTAILVAAFLLYIQPVSAQTACTSSASAMTAIEQQAFMLVNQYRQQNGVAPLAFSPALQRAAKSHSDLMAATGVFAHDSLAATQTRFMACGENGNALGENIAGGNLDPAATVQQWINSPEHRANMLDADFTDTGIALTVGIYTTGGTTYSNFAMWTQEFSNGAGVAPVPQPVPAPIPQPIPTPAPVPTPQPSPVPIPVPVPQPQPVPVPRPVPIPQPQPLPVTIPVSQPPVVVSPGPVCQAPAYYRTGAPPECPQATQPHTGGVEASTQIR